MEAEILSEIKEAEKKAEEILERVKREKESILHQAIINSSKLLAAKEEELRKEQEKKIMDFREKAKLIREEKLAEGKVLAKQLKTKADKNTAKAVEFVLKRFEEMI
jgi:vacuolar-type H+-ATPase subunit H